MNAPQQKTSAPPLPRHLRNRFIAAELLRLRHRSGKTGEQVARHMKWSSSKVSRMEHGRSPIDGEDLRKLLLLLGATKREAARIIRAAADSDPGPGDYRNAAAVLEWATTALPGAVQRPAYAWAVETAQDELARRDPKAAEAAVETNLRWQYLAVQTSFRIEVIFDESALSRQYGGQAAMENQLSYMLAMGNRENVSIRMVPVTAAGLPVVSSFLYVQFPGKHTLSAADTVLLRQPQGDATLVLARETYHYHFAFEHLRRAALGEDHTRQSIEEALQWWGSKHAA